MKKWLVILLILLLSCVIILLGSVMGISLIRKSPRGTSSPVVEIHSPAPDETWTTGQPIMLQAVANDPDGVVRIEFWLDGELLKFEQSPWESGMTPLPLAHSIRLDQAGNHPLIVRGVDTLGNSGQSSMTLSVAEGAPPAASGGYIIQEGDTLERIAESLEISPGEIIEANPEITDSLPPAGEEITLPTPTGEEADDEVPPAVSYDGLIDMPPYFPPPIETSSWYALPFHRFTGPRTVPSGWLDIPMLEVDSEYDGVFCYASAGDSPVIRLPADGFLTHLSGNYWDIAEWFSGEHMLPLLSADASLRLRMNCVGFNHTPTGGIAHDLGTLDITRPISEAGSGLIDERTAGDGRWFHIQFTVRPISKEADDGGTGFDYLYLDSSRYPRDAILTVPDPHIILEFRIYDEGEHVEPPVMDGFLIFRDGTLWRTAGPNTEHYVVWDHLLEAGGCGEQTEFFIIGYTGAPLAPTTTIKSSPILISGYCPPETLFKTVTVQFNWFYVNCVSMLDEVRIGLHTGGLGMSCGEEGQPPCTPETAVYADCAGALDNYGPVSYGGLNVNGERVIDFRRIIQFSPRFYNLHNPPWDDNYIYSVTLDPGETLTITSTLWDYDVWSDSDEMCPGTIHYSPEDLARLAVNDETETRIVRLSNSESHCLMEYQISVETSYAPPPVIIP